MSGHYHSIWPLIVSSPALLVLSCGDARGESDSVMMSTSPPPPKVFTDNPRFTAIVGKL